MPMLAHLDESLVGPNCQNPTLLAIAFSLHRSSLISCLSDVPLESQSEKVAHEQTWLGEYGNRMTGLEPQLRPA